MTWRSRTLPLPPPPAPRRDESAGSAALPPEPPSEAPGEASLALSSGPAWSGASVTDPASSWGDVPAHVLAPPAAYPPLPRAYLPTQASMQGLAPTGAPTTMATAQAAWTQVAGAPAGLLAGQGEPGGGVASQPGPETPPAVAERAPRRTALLLGQTASVDAPDARVSAEIAAPGELRPLPPDAPPWMVTARYLSGLLEAAIAHGEASPHLKAAAQRAVGAFRLSSHPPAQVARVVHLVVRAHDAIRSTSRGDLREVIRDCALVIQRSLPADLRARMSEQDVVAVVEAMQHEPDARRARGLAAARLLGWPDLPEAWLLDAIDAALHSAP